MIAIVGGGLAAAKLVEGYRDAGGTDAIFGAKVDGVGYGKWSPRVSASIRNAVAAQYRLLKAGKVKGIPATVK